MVLKSLAWVHQALYELHFTDWTGDELCKSTGLVCTPSCVCVCLICLRVGEGTHMHRGPKEDIMSPCFITVFLVPLRQGLLLLGQ